LPLTTKGRCNTTGGGVVAALVWVAAIGCGHSPSSDLATEARLSRLGLSYGLYTGSHEGRPPSNLDELRQHVGESITKEQLGALGVTNVEELFVSPRDSKPYKIIALPHLPAPVPGQQPPVVLYEQVGLKGKHYVARVGGAVEEVDEERFQQLVSAK
jgi:hypothetical protein